MVVIKPKSPHLIVPTLRVVMPPRTLRVPQTTRIQAGEGDAERHGTHSRAEQGNDQDQKLPG